MQSLIISKTKSTPAVSFEKQTGTFIISGRSLPENVVNFYQPVIEWLELYFQDPNKITLLIFELEFFNTASSKIFIYIFKLLNKAFHVGHQISVEWRYMADDTDSLEAGMDYSSLVQVPFIYNELQCK
jgi:hypothetical protein